MGVCVRVCVGTSEGNRAHKFYVVTHAVDGGRENRFNQYVTVSSRFVPGRLDLLEGSGGNSHAELQPD